MQNLEQFTQENLAHLVAAFMAVGFIMCVCLWVAIEIWVAKKCARHRQEKQRLDSLIKNFKK